MPVQGHGMDAGQGLHGLSSVWALRMLSASCQRTGQPPVAAMEEPSRA